MKFKKIPFVLQCLMLAFVWNSVILLFFALPDYLFWLKTKDKDRKLMLLEWTSTANIHGMPICVLSFFACASVSLHFVASIVLHFIPHGAKYINWIITRKFVSGKFLEYISVFEAIKHVLLISCWALLTNISYSDYIMGQNWVWKIPNDPWIDILQNIFVCIFCVSLIWVFKGLILEFTRVKLIRRVFKERISALNDANSVLETFNSINTEILFSPDNSKFEKIEKKKAIWAQKTLKLVRKELRGLFVNSKCFEKTTSIPQDESQAESTARNIFRLLTETETQVQSFHFEKYFLNQKDAQYAFNMFDVDGNLFITEQEMKSMIKEWIREKNYIQKSVKDIKHALKSLNRLLNVVAAVIGVFVGLFCFKVPVESFLSAAAAIFLPTVH